jgi:hypothetical protein
VHQRCDAAKQSRLYFVPIFEALPLRISVPVAFHCKGLAQLLFALFSLCFLVRWSCDAAKQPRLCCVPTFAVSLLLLSASGVWRRKGFAQILCFPFSLCFLMQ